METDIRKHRMSIVHRHVQCCTSDGAVHVVPFARMLGVTESCNIVLENICYYTYIRFYNTTFKQGEIIQYCIAQDAKVS